MSEQGIMFDPLDVKSKNLIEIRPKDDWTSSGQVSVRVGEEPHEETPLPTMAWCKAYKALVTRLEINEHQLAALSRRFEHGRTLRLHVICRRSDLVDLGFLTS